MSAYSNRLVTDVTLFDQRATVSELDLLAAISGDNLARSLRPLSDQLRYMDRREDALMAIQEATELYWQLAAEQSVAARDRSSCSIPSRSS